MMDFETTSQWLPPARRGAVLLLAGLLGLARASAATHAEAGTSQIRARFLMGTLFRFEAPAGGDPAMTGEALEDALDEVERLEGILSNWRRDSELSRLNRKAALAPVRVSPDLYRAVKAALRWASVTGGAFDPTVEPLTRRFRSPALATTGAAGHPPELRPGTWRSVELDSRTGSVRFAAGVEGLDLGGIGKGYALDRAAALLKRRGLAAALLDAGGQVLALGSPPGEDGWRIAVAHPGNRHRPALPILLRDASAATSGNSERPGEILDPATGSSIASAGSATAVSGDATSADALSTALFVLGPDRGIRWARGRGDLVALYLEPASDLQSPPRVRGSLKIPRIGGGMLRIAPGLGGEGRILDVRVF